MVKILITVVILMMVVMVMVMLRLLMVRERLGRRKIGTGGRKGEKEKREKLTPATTDVIVSHKGAKIRNSENCLNEPYFQSFRKYSTTKKKYNFE